MLDLPDARGHFGPYGGVFVAETLIRALDDLKAQYARYQKDPALPRRIRARAQALRRPAVARVPRGALVARAGRRADLAEARGPQSHRRAQDQQRDRAGAACPADGQAARHRRDRRRPAWRRHGDHRRALRHGMRRVHGLGGHQAPGAERVPDEPAGRQGRSGRIRLEDAEGRAERGDARLGHQHREHVLHHRHGGRTASVSDDGARFPARDRRRVRRADAGIRRPPARRRHRLRRRRQQRDGHLLSVHPVRGRAPDRRRGGRRGHRLRQALGVADRGPSRRPARQPHLSAAGRQRPDHRNAFDFRGPRLSGRRSRARVAQGFRTRALRGRRRRRGARGVPPVLPHRGHHSRAGIGARAGVRDATGADACRRTRSCWSIFPAAATRT